MLHSLPNLHPFLVHFPIALFTSAVLADLVLLAWARLAWLDRAATLVYAGAAVSSGAAAWSGKLAEPAAAEGALAEALGTHGDWAFITVVLFFLVGFLRFDALWRDRAREAPRIHRGRIVAFALALLAQASLLRTAEYGGSLVFRHGVGVIVPRR
ncbi:MAG TPA: DUF2231 domain-containing protein [Vicinamibacteria bacterium]|nr:DUF2231 domain-containing protein [Vicinamibacteria bacterium]